MLEQRSGMASAARTLKGFGTPLNTRTGCHTCFETGKQPNNLPNFETGMPFLPVSKSPDFEKWAIWRAPVSKPELPNGPYGCAINNLKLTVRLWLTMTNYTRASKSIDHKSTPEELAQGEGYRTGA
jgi:hypothetical protein